MYLRLHIAVELRCITDGREFYIKNGINLRYSILGHLKVTRFLIRLPRSEKPLCIGGRRWTD